MNEMKSHALVDTTDLLYGLQSFCVLLFHVFKCFQSCKKLKETAVAFM